MVAWELEPKLWPSARYQFCSLLTWRALVLLIARRAMHTANMSQRERLGRRERLDRWWWFKHWFKQKKEDGSGSERLGRLALTEHYNHLRWHFHCIVVSWLLLFVSIFFFVFLKRRGLVVALVLALRRRRFGSNDGRDSSWLLPYSFFNSGARAWCMCSADGDSPRRRIYPLRPRWLGTISRYSFSYLFPVRSSSWCRVFPLCVWFPHHHPHHLSPSILFPAFPSRLL